MKSKYLIIRLICVITSIILAIYFLIGKVNVSKLMPYILINLLVYQISAYKENNSYVQYTKYDGIKIILSSILFLGVVTIVMLIVHQI